MEMPSPLVVVNTSVQGRPGKEGSKFGLVNHHPIAVTSRNAVAEDYPDRICVMPLVNRGLSQISPDDFSRLCTGPLGEAIFFLGSHVKGRNAVVTGRNQIHGQIQAQSSSRSGDTKIIRFATRTRNETSFAYVEKDKAVSRLASAQTSYDVFKRDLDVKQALLEEKEVQLRALQNNLNEKRAVALLLTTLEQEEKPRLRRIEATGGMIWKFRANVQREITENALHAHHITLARVVKVNNTQIRESFDLLRKAIMRHLVDPTDLEAQLCRFIDAADRNARRELQYKPGRAGPTTLELDAAMHHINLAQNPSKGAKRQIIKVSTADRASFWEKSSSIKSYLDVARCRLLERKAGAVEDAFVTQIRTALEVRGNIGQAEILRRVDTFLRKAHQQDLLLSTTSLLSAQSSISAPVADLLETTNRKTAETEDAATNLLQRKIQKAELGNGLVKDVECLLKESSDISGRLKRRNKAGT
ncbi:hypothetical protein C8J56DRAFT_884193 [Mycena floridula]|nr:hypothetical protein C8J56DRAFT_884193 [Mycena floridula]